MEQLLQKRLKVATGLATLEEKKRQLLKGAAEAAARTVSIVERIHPGATLRAGDAEYSVSEETAGPLSLVWKPESEEFTIVEFVPIQEQLEKKLKTQEEPG